MEMHQVRYFLAVCETLNFTRAAENCYVAQPSLTRPTVTDSEQLENLEDALTTLGRHGAPPLSLLLVDEIQHMVPVRRLAEFAG